MATFKVGQRIKVVARRRPEDVTPEFIPAVFTPLGSLGTIGSLPDDPENRNQYGVRIDTIRSAHPTGELCFQPYMLAPLTDPAADAFMERIKKLKPYDEPVVVKTKERA